MFLREWSREKIAEPSVTKALTLHQVYVAKVSQTSPPHPQIHLDRSRCTSDFAGADCPDYKFPAISMVVSCCIMLYPVLVVDLHWGVSCASCDPEAWFQWQIFSHLQSLGSKRGPRRGRWMGAGMVGSTWGSQVDALEVSTDFIVFTSGCHSSVALAVVTWPCPAVCIPKMISLLVCSVCFVSFCIHFWPFHLGIDSWPFAMVQTHFAPRKLDGWAWVSILHRMASHLGCWKVLVPHIWFTTAGFVPNSDSDMSMSSWFSTGVHGFPMDLPHICCLNIPSIAQGGDIFQRWSPGESPWGFRPKTRGFRWF